MIGFLLALIVLCLILGVAWWVISMIPLPAPLNWVVRVIFGIVVLIILLVWLLPLAGEPGLVGRWR
jgi:hypothetical protein